MGMGDSNGAILIGGQWVQPGSPQYLAYIASLQPAPPAPTSPPPVTVQPTSSQNSDPDTHRGSSGSAVAGAYTAPVIPASTTTPSNAGKPVVIQAISGRPGSDDVAIIQWPNGEISSGRISGFSADVQSQAASYIQSHLMEQPGDSKAVRDSEAAKVPGFYSPLSNQLALYASENRQAVSIPQGSDFAATRKAISGLPNFTPIRLNDSSNLDVFSYNGGLINQYGQYYTGYGGNGAGPGGLFHIDASGYQSKANNATGGSGRDADQQTAKAIAQASAASDKLPGAGSMLLGGYPGKVTPGIRNGNEGYSLRNSETIKSGGKIDLILRTASDNNDYQALSIPGASPTVRGGRDADQQIDRSLNLAAADPTAKWGNGFVADSARGFLQGLASYNTPTDINYTGPTVNTKSLDPRNITRQQYQDMLIEQNARPEKYARGTPGYTALTTAFYKHPEYRDVAQAGWTNAAAYSNPVHQAVMEQQGNVFAAGIQKFGGSMLGGVPILKNIPIVNSMSGSDAVMMAMPVPIILDPIFIGGKAMPTVAGFVGKTAAKTGIPTIAGKAVGTFVAESGAKDAAKNIITPLVKTTGKVVDISTKGVGTVVKRGTVDSLRAVDDYLFTGSTDTALKIVTDTVKDTKSIVNTAGRGVNAVRAADPVDIGANIITGTGDFAAGIVPGAGKVGAGIVRGASAGARSAVTDSAKGLTRTGKTLYGGFVEDTGTLGEMLGIKGGVERLATAEGSKPFSATEVIGNIAFGARDVAEKATQKVSDLGDYFSARRLGLDKESLTLTGTQEQKNEVYDFFESIKKDAADARKKAGRDEPATIGGTSYAKSKNINGETDADKFINTLTSAIERSKVSGLSKEVDEYGGLPGVEELSSKKGGVSVANPHGDPLDTVLGQLKNQARDIRVEEATGIAEKAQYGPLPVKMLRNPLDEFAASVKTEAEKVREGAYVPGRVARDKAYAETMKAKAENSVDRAMNTLNDIIKKGDFYGKVDEVGDYNAFRVENEEDTLSPEQIREYDEYVKEHAADFETEGVGKITAPVTVRETTPFDEFLTNIKTDAARNQKRGITSSSLVPERGINEKNSFDRAMEEIKMAPRRGDTYAEKPMGWKTPDNLDSEIDPVAIGPNGIKNEPHGVQGTVRSRTKAAIGEIKDLVHDLSPLGRSGEMVRESSITELFENPLHPTANDKALAQDILNIRKYGEKTNLESLSGVSSDGTRFHMLGDESSVPIDHASEDKFWKDLDKGKTTMVSETHYHPNWVKGEVGASPHSGGDLLSGVQTGVEKSVVVTRDTVMLVKRKAGGALEESFPSMLKGERGQISPFDRVNVAKAAKEMRGASRNARKMITTKTPYYNTARGAVDQGKVLDRYGLGVYHYKFNQDALEKIASGTGIDPLKYAAESTATRGTNLGAREIAGRFITTGKEIGESAQVGVSKNLDNFVKNNRHMFADTTASTKASAGLSDGSTVLEHRMSPGTSSKPLYGAPGGKSPGGKGMFTHAGTSGKSKGVIDALIGGGSVGAGGVMASAKAAHVNLGAGTGVAFLDTALRGNGNGNGTPKKSGNRGVLSMDNLISTPAKPSGKIPTKVPGGNGPGKSNGGNGGNGPASPFSAGTGGRTLVDLPQGGPNMFKNTRDILSGLPDMTPVQLGESDNMDAFAHMGGIVNSKGRFYTGYGGTMAPYTPKAKTGVLDTATVNHDIIFKGNNGITVTRTPTRLSTNNVTGGILGIGGKDIDHIINHDTGNGHYGPSSGAPTRDRDTGWSFSKGIFGGILGGGFTGVRPRTGMDDIVSVRGSIFSGIDIGIKDITSVKDINDTGNDLGINLGIKSWTDTGVKQKTGQDTTQLQDTSQILRMKFESVFDKPTDKPPKKDDFLPPIFLPSSNSGQKKTRTKSDFNILEWANPTEKWLH